MATSQFHSDAAGIDALHADLASADLQPLWTQHGLLPPVPNRLTPHIWRWKTLRELAERSGELIGIDRGGDRRVISLAHPDLDGLPFATHTLWGAVQFLRGGELAPAHRHSPAALRFVLEGSGVWTLVDGDALHMAPGDLVLTPSWTWHEHHNPGTEPMIWFDGLDLPLVRGLDAVFFEPGGEELSPYEPVLTSRSEDLLSEPGLLPSGEGRLVARPQAAGQPSRLLAYRWQATDDALARILGSTGRRSASVRYCDPATGRDIMPTLRAEMHRILAGHRTPTTRTAGSGIWVAYRGSGATVVNGRRFRWTAGDMLVTPSWAAVDHEATDDADLFLLSDGPVLDVLGLARTRESPWQDVTEEHAE